MRREEIIEGCVITDIEQVPVIQAGALQVLVIHPEAQRLDQVQHRAGDRAGARDIARVLRDLGLDQNDMEHALPPCVSKNVVFILCEIFALFKCFSHFAAFLSIRAARGRISGGFCRLPVSFPRKVC